MKVDKLISQLDKCKQTNHGHWLACCPAHDDKTPSLTISEADDGRILVHCFAGCSVESVIGAVNLTFSDLMPDEAPKDHVMTPKRLRYPPLDVLKAMEFQATVVAIAASDIAQGKKLTEDEKNKLFAIAGEFQEAIDLVMGK